MSEENLEQRVGRTHGQMLLGFAAVLAILPIIFHVTAVRSSGVVREYVPLILGPVIVSLAIKSWLRGANMLLTGVLAFLGIFYTVWGAGLLR